MTGDIDSDSLELVLDELGSDEAAEPAVELDVEPALDVDVALVPAFDVDVVLVPEEAGAERLVAAFGGLLEPCEPRAAIAAQASANVEKLAAATWRRMRLMWIARARRACSPRVLEAAFAFDMGAT